MYLHLNFLSQLTQFLFRERELPYGQDLISLNIHRGRDMGLNDYNSYRELFGLPKAWSFEQMSDVLPRDVMAALHFHFFDCLCLFFFLFTVQFIHAAWLKQSMGKASSAKGTRHQDVECYSDRSPLSLISFCLDSSAGR